jgi:hypothetical protein
VRIAEDVPTAAIARAVTNVGEAVPNFPKHHNHPNASPEGGFLPQFFSHTFFSIRGNLILNNKTYPFQSYSNPSLSLNSPNKDVKDKLA